MRMHAGGGKQSTGMHPGEFNGLRSALETRSRDDHLHYAGMPGPMQDRVAIRIETVVCQVDADVDEFHYAQTRRETRANSIPSRGIAMESAGAMVREVIRFHETRLAGVDAMSANSARSFPRHTHDQFGMGVVDSGGHASLSDRRQVEAGPGHSIFVNPGEVHDGRAIGGRPRSWRMLYFDQAMIEEIWGDISEGADSPAVFSAAVFQDDAMRGLFNTAFAQATAATGSRDAMESETAIIRLAARARLNSTAKSMKSPATPCIRRARERIDADPSSSQLTLASLAAESQLSRYQVLRAFSREFGLTPHAYILQQRLGMARRLIRSGRGLAESAARAGFYDQSHLNRCFTRQFGVTPSGYASTRP
jgi:AraC-like DNA-binding protein